MTTTDQRAMPDGEVSPMERSDARARHLGDGIVAASIAVQATTTWLLGRHLWWFSDDWNILARYAHGEILEPFNGHLSILPVGLFRAMFEIVGIDRYGPYRVVGLATYFGFGVLLYVYGRRQVPPTVAALGSCGLMWLSVAGFNLTFPFLINFTIPVGATVVAWWLLEADRPRRDAAAALALAVALASSGLGIVTAIAIGAELAWRRAPLRRWLPHAIPLVLWAAWYLAWSEPAGRAGRLGETATYFRQQLQATFWAAGATNRVAGLLLAVGFAVLLIVAVRSRTFGGRAFSSLAACLSFTALTAYSRVGVLPRIPPDTGRYLWVNVAYLTVAAFALARGRRIPNLAIVALALLVAANAVVLIGDLRDHDRGVAAYAQTVRIHLVEAELAPDGDDRILPLSVLPVTVADYQDAVDAYGSPIAGIGPDDLEEGSPERASADAALTSAMGLRLVDRPPDGCPVAPMGSRSDRVSVPAETTVAVHAERSDVEVSVSRIADDAHPDAMTALDTVEAGTTRWLTLPVDRDPDLGARFPWTIAAPGGAVQPCP